MANWANINDNNNRFRLLCNNPTCSLSVANLIDGILHITTVHGSNRHSMLLSHEDMRFIVSQYLNSLSETDRRNLLNFFESF